MGWLRLLTRQPHVLILSSWLRPAEFVMTDENNLFSGAVRRAYEAGEEDESLSPLVRVDGKGRPAGRIGPRDSVIFYDVRGEREITLTRSFCDPGFKLFPTERLGLNFVTIIEYGSLPGVKSAFPPEGRVTGTLTEVLGSSGFRVIKISESEKATHVGFFFNGKSDELFPGEERIVVPSPRVGQYSETPEMNASGIVREIATGLRAEGRMLIVANLANVDEVGHLEDRDAVLRSVRSVDESLGEILLAAEREKATVLVTSDHGTVEEWLYPDGTVNTGHTANPVPFVLLDFAAPGPGDGILRRRGGLADVAPTLLSLAGVPQPSVMSGRSLIEGGPRGEPRQRIILLVLDGWGHRDEAFGNMIKEAGAPNFERIWKSFPHAILDSSGEAVGMPDGTVGNSEAGHLHLGAGRRVSLDRVRIDKAIASGTFFRNESLLWAMDESIRGNRPLHLMGIVSFYSSHGTIEHLFALMRMASEAGVKKVYVHSFIGRRNDMPETGAVYIEKIEALGRVGKKRKTIKC